MVRLALAVAMAWLVATPALAEDLRDLCPTRPGLGTASCIVDKGHLLVEVGVGDWTLDRQPDERSDTILAGDILLRYGLGETSEVQLGLTSYGHVRTRDYDSGAVERTAGLGDARIAFKQSIAHPDGSGLSASVLPFVTVPVGHRDIGAGDWGAGLVLPVDYDLSETVQLQLTPEVDAAVDEDAHGRHLAYSLIGGVSVKLSSAIAATAELQAIRDEDPSGHTTQRYAAASIGWQPGANLQFDFGSAFGLDHTSADVRLYGGISQRF